MNVIEHTVIIQHTCAAVHVRRILHCLGVGQLMIIQQVSSALSTLNKTKKCVRVKVYFLSNKVCVVHTSTLLHP